jgi:hypothetical protein
VIIYGQIDPQGWRELPASEIRVGDKIIGYRLHGTSAWVPVNWAVGSITNNRVLSPAGDLLFGTDAVAMFRVVWANSPKPPTSKWNGTCPTCKRSTYTGFLKIEHEGGVCQRPGQF